MEDSTQAPALKPVTAGTLEMVDKVFASVEEEVAAQCVANDNPESSMGPEAAIMVRTGLGFVSKMLRTMMAFGAGNIIGDELGWGKERLPVYGVSMSMVVQNFERYAASLEKRLPKGAYNEIKPYLERLINGQRSIAENATGNHV